MKRQKQIRLLGIGLMMFSLFFMAYKYFKDPNDDITYMTMGLLVTIIGMFLTQYGSKKDN